MMIMFNVCYLKYKRFRMTKYDMIMAKMMLMINHSYFTFKHKMMIFFLHTNVEKCLNATSHGKKLKSEEEKQN